MVPGEGELPLTDILSVLPHDIVLEIEVPRRSLALAGVSPIDRVRRVSRRRTVCYLNVGNNFQLGSRSGSPAAR